ncbi:S-layer homology domain-containing protein [Vermiculatibacterium agrestimuris]|uniref:S-layer homology domain-containing protein n=1 Tax=Vermiculatibacterium agrestimuris TaxID=2941519 RepID=UPI0020412C55|nr:S-layer homology domain-containing protein [Vermiculatibacterium agrestimuris]
MRGKRSLGALALTLALVLGLAAPAFAAQLRLTYQMNSGGNAATLTLQGLGEESVYGVQLELTLPGSVTARFSPSDGGTYSPECRVETSDKSTRVTVYLTAQTPLNENGILPLGTLTVSKTFSMPGTVTVTLLNRELEAISGAGAAVASTSVQQTQSSDDDDDEPDRYRVRISSARNGAVKADVTRAEARAMVTLTVEPENRYGLETLKVTSSRGNEMALTDVGGNRFTFYMPSADVEVTASFHWTGLEHIDMNFLDVVESDWYHEAVHFVFESGMMKGTDQGLFSPDVDTSRGMIVTILHRLEGTPQAGLSGFADVPAGEYYTDAVGWAAQNGIVSGYGEGAEGMFGPNDSITREQLAAILYRYAEKKGLDVTVRGDLSTYADAGSVSDYAVEPLRWAVGVGLISGMGDGTIAPGGKATRAQVATILTRYCQNLAD